MVTDFLQTEVDAIRQQGLYRKLRCVESDQGPTFILDGQEVVNFCSNNYLGLANHPALREAAKNAIDRFGFGSGASRLISGNMKLHEELENTIAEMKGTEAALLFNSGFQANVGLFNTLVGEGDVILSDSLNHASIIDGCRLSRAKILIYSHRDLNRLESYLKEASGCRRKLIVTETVFSMDGDLAPLKEIVGLAEQYGAWVMVDEAHATGAFGPNGAGVVSEMGLGGRIAVQMGTLGKALGGFGAYVAGSRFLRDLLINCCRSFIFTTSLPPAVAAAAIAAIALIRREPERQTTLWENCKSFRTGLEKLGAQLGDSQSQIFPLHIGDPSRCMAISEHLLDRGIFVQGIRPPTVPPGTSRLRLTLMSPHTEAQLNQALNTLQEVMTENHVL